MITSIVIVSGQKLQAEGTTTQNHKDALVAIQNFELEVKDAQLN